MLPFYVLHQTVLLVAGYLVIPWGLPDGLEYAVIAVGSFASILLIYEALVRRYDPVRALFGMHTRGRVAAPVEPAPVGVAARA